MAVKSTMLFQRTPLNFQYHTVVHNCLELQLWVTSHSLLVSRSTRHTHDAQTYVQANHPYTQKQIPNNHKNTTSLSWCF